MAVQPLQLQICCQGRTCPDPRPLPPAAPVASCEGPAAVPPAPWAAPALRADIKLRSRMLAAPTWPAARSCPILFSICVCAADMVPMMPRCLPTKAHSVVKSTHAAAENVAASCTASLRCEGCLAALASKHSFVRAAVNSLQARWCRCDVVEAAARHSMAAECLSWMMRML